MQEASAALGSTSSDGEGSSEETKVRYARLDALGESLAKKRSEAIAGREASGIETQWIEDQEFYEGVDDANRDEHRNAWRTKPPGLSTTQVKTVTRSTVFPNITRPYVDAASARIADMLLPTDDRAWQIEPTPIPDLVDIADGKIPPEIQSQLANVPGVDQAQVDKASAAITQQAQREIEEAKKAADKAQTQIEDWTVESQYHAEVRKVIEDASRCGTGVLKGPVPVKRKVVALVDVSKDQAGTPSVLERLVGGIKKLFGKAVAAAQKVLEIKEEIKPASKRIDFWDFYPDPSCGENIHNGSHTWERDRLSERQLRDLLDAPGYLKEQIQACLDEGPKRAIAEDKKNPNQFLTDAMDKRFEIWYGHVNVDREDLAAASVELGPDEKPFLPAMVAMVNNRVVKAALNPLDSGEFPYDMMPWQRVSGIPWGVGVARQGRTAQRIVVGATRHLMDNGGLSAGPQIVMKKGAIVPGDGSYNLTPRKIWWWGEDAVENGKVTDAMTFFDVPSMQKDLMEDINFGMKLMEDSTGLPMLLQGQQGKAPDTVGGMTMLNNNASAVLRRLARTFDDCITEPHIRRYYAWLLQYSEDDSQKGDFTINARGSSALVERDMQAQQMPMVLKFSLEHPEIGWDPKKAGAEWLKSLHLDEQRFKYDDEEWKKIVQNMSQKPSDPRVQVETIKAEAADKRLNKEQQFDADQAQKERENKVALEMIQAKIDTLDLNSVERQVLEKIKTELTKTVITVNAQKELSAASLAVDVHKHHMPAAVATPPTEPAGRAAPDQSFSQ